MTIIDPGSGQDTHPVTAIDVVNLYQQYLHRDPENQGAIDGRIGLPYNVVRDEIANSLEAEMVRNAVKPIVADPDKNKAPGLPKTGSPPINVPNIPGLTGALQWLNDVLGGKISDAVQATNDAKKWLTDQLDVITSKALPVVQNSVKALEQGLTQATANLIPNTLSLIGAGVGGIGNLVSAIFSNMADVGDIADTFVSAIAGHKTTIAEFVLENGAGAVAMGLNNALAIIEGDHVEQLESILAPVRDAPGLPDVLKAALDVRASKSTPFALVIGLALMMGAASQISEAFLGPDIRIIEQKRHETMPVELIAPADAADAAIRGIRAYDPMASLAARQGLNDDQFRILADLRRQYPSVDDLMAAYFRGAIDEATLENNLERLGLSDEGRSIVRTVRQNIPNVSDVLRFLTRDVFIPEFVEAFGMDKEYPNDADEWAAKLGIPHEVMQLHWRSHWELPSVQLAFEMYQRNRITEQDLRRLLRAQGVEPYWRDPLIAISFNPLTRVDIRRIHKTLDKDRDWLVEQYKFTGYSPDNAGILADFTIALNSKEKKAELKDITDGLKNRVIAAVVSGSMDENTGRSLLKQIGYAPTEIDDFVLEARLFKHDARMNKITDLLGKLYVKGRRTPEEVRTRLSEAGFIPAEVDEVMRELDLEKELKEPDAQQEKDRDLTKAEILSAYSDKILSGDEARKALATMRYDPAEVATLIKIQDYKDKKSSDADAIEIVHQKYMKGTFDETTAITELDKVVSNAQHRNALLAKWTKEHATKVADIPLSSVQEMYQRDISDVGWTRTYLRHLGFDDDETERLMKLWDARKLEKAERDARAKQNAANKTKPKGAN